MQLTIDHDYMVLLLLMTSHPVDEVLYPSRYSLIRLFALS